VVLHPVFDERLGHLSFDYDSVYGTIHSDWTTTNAGATWHVTIPANTEGWLPMNPAEAFKCKLDGAPLNGNPHAKLTTHDGQNGFELGPGTYTFDIQLYSFMETSVSDVTRH
jgi:alpha-L-rhamnosidase